MPAILIVTFIPLTTFALILISELNLIANFTLLVFSALKNFRTIIDFDAKYGLEAPEIREFLVSLVFKPCKGKQKRWCTVTELMAICYKFPGGNI